MTAIRSGLLIVLGMLAGTAAGEPPLPSGAVARLGSPQLRQANQVFRIAFHPNGKVIATNGRGTLSFWDADTGKLIDQHELGAADYTMAFTPDGSLLVTAAPFAVWDVASRAVIRHFKTSAPLKEPVVLLSPDGTNVAAYPRAENTIAWWDVQTGAEIGRRCAHESHIAGAAFSSDGRELATADEDGNLSVWSVRAGTLLARHKGVLGRLTAAMAFSPDGRRIATGGALLVDGPDRHVRIWDASSGRPLATFGPAERLVSSLAYSPNGKLLASGYRGSVRLWDATSGRQMQQWDIGGGDVEHVAFSPDSKTLAATSYGNRVVHLWDAATGKERFPLGGHAGPVQGLAFKPDGRTLFSVGGGVVEWDVPSAKERRRFAPTAGEWNDLAISPDGRHMVFTGLGPKRREIYVRDLRPDATARILPNELALGTDFSFVGEFAFSAGAGRWLGMSRSRRELVGLWDLTTGARLAPVPAGGVAPPQHIALSADGKFVATVEPTGADESADVSLWDTHANKQVHRLTVGPLPRPVFSPTCNKVLLVNSQGYIFWDATTGRQRAVSGSDLPHSSAAFSPDGQLVAIGGENAIHIWETATWRELSRFAAPPAGGIHSLTFSPDRRTLASGLGRGEVILWDVTGRRGARDTPAFDAARLARCWELLADTDAAKSYAVVWELADNSGRAVPFLRERLRQAVAGAESRFARLMGELDDRSYAVRQRAGAQLSEFRPALPAALGGKLSAEARRRIEQILGDESKPLPVQLRRAIQALEYAGTPEARAALGEISAAWGGCSLVEQAKAALARLER